MQSIIDLPNIIGSLKEDEKQLFNRFFLVQESIGKLTLPEEMKPWAEKKFGSVESVENQKIVKVFNRLTFEKGLFNDLRAKRPIETQNDENVLKEINDNSNDNFCKPLAWTAADVFGRVKGKYSITASNIAKYDALHGLVIFKNHNPLDFSEKEMQDYFHVALKWFDKAYKSNKNAHYPFLLWNCLWRAAASIIHGHMQLVLGEGSHYAEPEYYNRIRKEYDNMFNSDYYSDFYHAHEMIGLGLESKKIRIFTNITPRKDKEVTLMAEKFDRHFVSAIYKVANCLIKDFGVMSFNLSIIFPPLNKDIAWKGFPVLARIVDRGKLSNKTTDIGGMEMYARSNVIETDPYMVFEKVKSYF